MTAFCEAHGLSKACLALLLGVGGRWESGKGQPREAQKAKIMELLALSEEQLRHKLSEFSEKMHGTGNVPQNTPKEKEGDKESSNTHKNSD